MTFSIVARCAETGAFGMIVTSSSVCVASRCAWVRAGAGAVATQNLTNPALGEIGLDLLAQGIPAGKVLEALQRVDPQPAYRQLMVIDAQGATSTFTGESALPLVASARGRDCAAAGNLLASSAVPDAMVAAFEAASGPLALRLLAAADAGLAEGGEVRVLRSAGLLCAHTERWPETDLRIDCADFPLTALRELWGVHEPLRDGYVSRAYAPQLAVIG
jgi:uncharacterized Ntn-hydrolase superfamily protein